jgi:hypothetical protein
VLHPIALEWRWQARRFPSPLRHTGRPLWSGEPLNGRTILLHAEQGFGDCLQFLRYVSYSGIWVTRCSGGAV